MRYLIIGLLLISPFGFTFAQTDLNFSNINELRIDLNTDTLEPFSEVTASINDYSIPDTISSINWMLDGKNLAESKNQRNITFNLKKIGQNSVVEAFLETTNHKTFSVKKVISPVYLDIIIEPQTRTPSFYKGRALPSTYSTINLTAIVNGDLDNADKYLYNWSLNDMRIDGGTIIGGYKVSTQIPLTSFNVVSLSITDKSNKLIARKSIDIPTVDPILLFYTVNSLYGVGNIPIKDKLTFSGESVVVKAEPYYLDIKTYNQPQIAEWKVDGTRRLSRQNNPYEITFSGNDRFKKAKVNFHVRSLTQILQGAEANFKIN